MEAYRSGHNGPHSKCGYRPKRYKGSNPFASAKDGSAWGRTRKGLTEAVKPFSYAPFGLCRHLLQLREDEIT